MALNIAKPISPDLVEAAVPYLLRRTDRPSDQECWPWTGPQGRRGYGLIRVRKTTIIASRAAFSAWVRPLREGELVCHSCDNPPCCNPAHLFAGSHAENAADRAQKGRSKGAPRGSANHAARLTEAQVLAIKADPRPQAAIAASFGVTQPYVSDIKTGRTWGWLS